MAALYFHVWLEGNAYVRYQSPSVLKVIPGEYD